MKPIPDSDWEYNKIGIAGPPIKTEQGWFLIYHGTSSEKGYCLGAALLDLDDPSKVLARQNEPILEPELDWELNGYIPNLPFLLFLYFVFMFLFLILITKLSRNSYY
jgi:predicted GH43/DUF377 family glycosyl hydrolase